MEKSFSQFIDLSKPIGKMFICGKEGSGKTLLNTFIGVEQMLRGIIDVRNSENTVREYNSLGYDFVVNYDHLCVSNYNINCLGTYQPNQSSYVVNPYKIGLWSEEYDTDFFAPGTTFHITEAHQVFNAYRWQYTREEVKNFWTTSRQAKFSAIFDTNRPNEVIKDLRDLCNRFIYLYKKLDDVYQGGRIIGHRLYVWEFAEWGDLEKVLNGGKPKNFEEYTLYLHRNTRVNYDSYFCKYLHLKGRLGQQFKVEHFPEIKTVEDVEEFADVFGLSPPVGYYVKQSKYAEKKEEKPSDDEDFEGFSFE